MHPGRQASPPADIAFDNSHSDTRTQRRRELRKYRVKKVQFSDRQLHISDRGDCGGLKFRFRPIFYQNGSFQPHFSYFWRHIFRQKNIFPTG